MNPAGNTPSQTAGPFFSLGLRRPGWDQLVAAGHPGALLVEGQVLDGALEPVPDAMVEIWQADPEGRFPPATAAGWTGFGRSLTDDEGSYRFRTLKPGPVRIGGGRLQAPHLLVQVFARGLLRQVRTRVYFPDEADANRRDPVLTLIPEDGRRRTLVAQATPNGVRFDVVLQGERETVFLDD
ncbi:MAG: protocatechuate 3,4-dioxygenase subunit alpha [Candidatus Dormibacteria bacterium]